MASEDEGGSPLGTWRAFYGVVLGVLVSLIALFTILSQIYK